MCIIIVTIFFSSIAKLLINLTEMERRNLFRFIFVSKTYIMYHRKTFIRTARGVIKDKNSTTLLLLLPLSLDLPNDKEPYFNYLSRSRGFAIRAHSCLILICSEQKGTFLCNEAGLVTEGDETKSFGAGGRSYILNFCRGRGRKKDWGCWNNTAIHAVGSCRPLVKFTPPKFSLEQILFFVLFHWNVNLVREVK